MSEFKVKVEIWLTDRGKAEFASFEDEIQPTLERHGGKFIEIQKHGMTTDPDIPEETHWLSFPTEKDFDAYLCDPETVGRKSRRDALAEKSSITIVG